MRATLSTVLPLAAAALLAAAPASAQRASARAVTPDLAVAGPVVESWQLFDTVQRLPRESQRHGPFTVIESFSRCTMCTSAA